MKGNQKKEDPKPSQKDNTSVGMENRLHSDINSGINMNMKILDQSGMVYLSYCSWDHIAMVCENWISQLISDLTHNNILATLIYIHTQLFMSIDVMVWVSTYLGCKVWVVNCKLLLLFNMVGSCYIIDEGCSSMWVAWCKNWSWKSNITKEEISPLGASMCVVPFSISLVGISKVKNQKTNIVNYYHSQYFPFFMS